LGSGYGCGCSIARWPPCPSRLTASWAQILRSIQNFGTRGLCCVPTAAASWSAPPRCVPCRAIEEVLWPGSSQPGHPSTDPAWMCLLGTGRGHQKSSGSQAHQSVGQLGKPAHGKRLMGGLGRIPIALSSFQAPGWACCPGGRDVMFSIKYNRWPKEGANRIAATEGKSPATEGRPSAGD
jgi:hypothetical protein